MNHNISDLLTAFDHLRMREKGLNQYMQLFKGREDCFARQWINREAGTHGYVPVHRALQPEDIQDHLKGHKTYGIYLLQADSTTRLGVIDVDLGRAFRKTVLKGEMRRQVQRDRDYLLSRLPEISLKLKMPCLTEVSGGKGYHFWYFWETPVPAADVRQLLSRIVKQISPDINSFEFEVFPKQDRLAGKGLGNLVKLPLGIHRVTGRISFFTHVQAKNTEAQLQALETVPLISSDVLNSVNKQPSAVFVLPRQQAWADTYPELALLMDRCFALNSLIVTCRQHRDLSVREEKILISTLGFLPRAKTLLHHLFQFLPDYNPHLVNYKLSRLRGTPLGCRRIHSLMGLSRDFCQFENISGYAHPLWHCPQYQSDTPKAENITNLNDALEELRNAISVVQRFMPKKD